VPVIKLRFRRTECGSRRTYHVVTAKNALRVTPWRQHTQ
jgi:hypothetical protein